MWSQDLCIETLDFAGRAHRNQKISGKDYSFVVHVASVCSEICRTFFIEQVIYKDLAIQCAILHDVLEDTDVNYDEIKSRFGKPVADGVLALTMNGALPHEDRMADSVKRIKKQPVEIAMVKLAGRIVNLRNPSRIWGSEEKKLYLEESAFIHKNLKYCSRYLSERLADKMEEYKNMKQT